MFQALGPSNNGFVPSRGQVRIITMFTAILASALLGFAPLKIDITVRDTKDGDTIAAEKTFRITAQSDHPVTKVEFYVGDSLRDSDSSTPYEFVLDPLNEADGNLKVSFVAYTTEGERAKKDLTLKVDTGVSKGADFHVARGMDLLVDRKWNEAILAGRIALKAKPGNNPARILMARAYMGLGAMDKAQQFAEDALAADASFAEGRELLAAINLKKALNSVSRGGENPSSSARAEALKVVADAMKSAVTLRRANLDAMADTLPAVTDENRLRVADGNIRAMRYDAAVRVLWPTFLKDPKNSALGNRIAYAQIRQSKLADAAETIREMEKANGLDAYGSALQAVLLAIAGQDAESDKVMADAIGNDPENLGVRTGQVYIALKRGRTNAFGNLINSLAKDEGQRTEVNYYLSILQQALRSFTEADERFGSAVLAEPANADMYVERGNQAVLMVLTNRITDNDGKNHQYAVAEAYYQAALGAWPESPQALAAIAVLRAVQGKPLDAVTFSDAAMKAGTGYAAAHYVGSMILATASVDATNRASKLRADAKGTPDAETRLKISDLERASRDYTERANKAKAEAERLDPRQLSGRSIPKALDVFEYFYRHGRIVQLSLP